jgi:hypothetical protein
MRLDSLGRNQSKKAYLLGFAAFGWFFAGLAGAFFALAGAFGAFGSAVTSPCRPFGFGFGGVPRLAVSARGSIVSGEGRSGEAQTESRHESGSQLCFGEVLHFNLLEGIY